MKSKILIIEDEPAIAENIKYALETEGFDTTWHNCGGRVIEHLSRHEVALIVLDIGLPDINGMELCKEIRKKSNIPIIFLTARSDEIDRIVGLEIGGDDYMVKPFSPRELSARVKAVLRRYEVFCQTTADKHKSNLFQIDDPKRQI
ncbi:MAG: response regulator, partial [Desulfobacteraceae bacterium]|nr:response regulator [Desulfobacteraceae bacterium]